MVMPTAHDTECLLHEVINFGVHRATYKNGAFKTQIQPSTDPIDAIRIFIDSPLTTNTEKAKFRILEQKILNYRRDPRDDGTAYMELFASMLWLESNFVDDQRRRGIAIPPTVLQTYKADGSVRRTHSIDDDGTFTSIAGGPDLRPGLFAGYGAYQSEQKADADKKENKQDPASTPTSSTSTPQSKQTEPKTNAAAPAAAKATTSNPDAKGDDSSTFGNDFARNLRRGAA